MTNPILSETIERPYAGIYPIVTAANADVRDNQLLGFGLKRVLDISVSLLALLLLAPFAILIALSIKLTSRGPVLFKQQRVGLWGKHFTMLKFRTMKTGSDPEIHRRFVREFIRGTQPASETKLKNDLRITAVGRLLRRTALDEIPQFLNVLNGDMSLVGPRPCLPYEYACYETWHRGRVKAVPGLTGLWQVSDRNRVSFDQMVRMDLDYIHHRSLWLDISILLSTPAAIISGNGAR